MRRVALMLAALSGTGSQPNYRPRHGALDHQIPQSSLKSAHGSHASMLEMVLDILDWQEKTCLVFRIASRLHECMLNLGLQWVAFVSDFEELA